MTNTVENVGFIGLGNMGGAIALRLLRVGFSMTVLDLDAAKMQPLLDEGAAKAASPREVAEASNIVLASLQSSAVEQVALGADGITQAGKKGLVFVDLSSTTPELAITLSGNLRSRGIEMLDSPVSGADIGAINGSLTLFVGGEYAAFERALPVLQHVGRTVTYLGKNGNGQIGKRINQMMQAIAEAAIYEGLTLAEKMGLDPKMFARAVAGGCAQSWRLSELVENVFNNGERKYKLRLRPGRTGNALKMAKQAGLTLRAAQATHEIFSEHDWQVVLDLEKAQR